MEGAVPERSTRGEARRRGERGREKERERKDRVKQDRGRGGNG